MTNPLSLVQRSVLSVIWHALSCVGLLCIIADICVAVWPLSNGWILVAWTLLVGFERATVWGKDLYAAWYLLRLRQRVAA